MTALASTSVRRTRSNPQTVAVQSPIRCAIYTRKSTDEGLKQSFNTLDAQREAAESYIASQTHAGWEPLAARYDDGGFSGGTTERPAFQRLLRDVEAGLVDRVVVYKVDRLSRSLLDFAKIMEVFDTHGVGLVSVTQQLDTSSSMGRLMLNVLFSFAQFERDLISERTKDKMSAARKKGKFTGGTPVLGYDIVSDRGGLVVTEPEAEHVRAIFDLYLDLKSLSATVKDLNARGWTTKQWTSKKGKSHGGKPFTKSTLRYLLVNPIFVGQVRYGGEIYAGEHKAIVDRETWDRVQDILTRSRVARRGARVRHDGLLTGLLTCGPCQRAMTHSFTRKGSTTYRYYTCVRAQKEGRAACPTKSVAAGKMEAFVVEHIRTIGQSPELLAETIVQARHEIDERRKRADAEVKSAAQELQRLRAAEAAGADIADAERTLTEAQAHAAQLAANELDESHLAEALATFDPIWDALSNQERGEALRLLIDGISYDGESGDVEIRFRDGAPIAEGDPDGGDG